MNNFDMNEDKETTIPATILQRHWLNVCQKALYRQKITDVMFGMNVLAGIPLTYYFLSNSHFQESAAALSQVVSGLPNAAVGFIDSSAIILNTMVSLDFYEEFLFPLTKRNYTFFPKTDPFSTNLRYSQCETEIKELKELANEKNILSHLKNALFSEDNKALILAGPFFLRFFLPSQDIVMFLFISVYLRMRGKMKTTNQQKHKIELCNPILSELNKVFEELGLDKSIQLNFVAETMPDLNDGLGQLESDELLPPGALVIYNSKYQLGKADEDFYYYVMLNVSTFLENFFDIRTKILSSDGMVVDVDDALIGNSRWGYYPRVKRSIQTIYP